MGCLKMFAALEDMHVDNRIYERPYLNPANQDAPYNEVYGDSGNGFAYPRPGDISRSRGVWKVCGDMRMNVIVHLLESLLGIGGDKRRTVTTFGTYYPCGRFGPIRYMAKGILRGKGDPYSSLSLMV